MTPPIIEVILPFGSARPNKMSCATSRSASRASSYLLSQSQRQKPNRSLRPSQSIDERTLNVHATRCE